MTVHFTETWPEGYAQSYEGYLYNQEAFVQLQKGSKTVCRSFYALDTIQKVVIGKAHFFKEEPNYTSPFKAPFGSFDMGLQLTTGQINDFIQFVLEQLKEETIHEIRVLHPAAVYHPEHTEIVKESLLKAGFLVNAAIPNHHIWVDDQALAEKMHSMEKRRWRKCQQAGFVFKEEPLDALGEVYNFILLCRKEKGWSLSMTHEALQKAVSVFPEKYKLFSVYNGNERIAATVAILVNSRILYNFYPAALLSYQKYSPTVMLINGLYQYCQEKGVKILDLGTSASDTLRRFKTHMGGEVSDKYEFVYRCR